MQKRTLFFSELLAASFILLFMYTALSKLLDWEKFRAVLSSSPALHPYAVVLAWGIPTVELVLCVLLFFPRWRRLGFTGSAFLLALFSSYVAYMLMSQEHLPCSCGGVISAMTWTQHLVFNIVMIVLAVVGIWMEYRNKFFIAINRSSPKPV